MSTSIDTSQIMYDMTGDNIHRLTAPPNPFAVGGYVNGAIQAFHWTPDDWAHFPDSYHVRINTTGVPGVGNCYDFESGDGGADGIAPWIESQLGQDDPLLVYCNRDNLDVAVAARASVHGWHGKVFLWVATLDGTVIANRSMTQFAQLHDAQGAYADVSVIINHALIALMAARVGHQS